MPVAPEDFHGDGLGSSDVDVVLTDRLLWNRDEATLPEEIGECLLADGAERAASLTAARTPLKFLDSEGTPAVGVVSTGHLLEALLRGHSAGPKDPSVTVAPDVDAGLNQSTSNDHPPESCSNGDRILTLARNIPAHELVGIDRQPSFARWDAPAIPFSLENRSAYASRGLDLRDRLAGNVHLDRVVKVTRVAWSGHVYNLSSSEGWYDANGIIVSNCDCLMVPTTRQAGAEHLTDPMAAFRAGQVRGLSQADIEAIRVGADMGQVVNVRRRSAGLMQGSSVMERGGRLTPQGIFRIVGDDDPLPLLRQHGYIV
jgi:hypothetical protein